MERLHEKIRTKSEFKFIAIYMHRRLGFVFLPGIANNYEFEGT